MQATLATTLPGATPGRQVAVSGSTAYVASYDYSPLTPTRAFLSAYDVSNPAAPVLRQTLSINPQSLTIAASGGYLYVAYTQGGGLLIYDGNLTLLTTYAGLPGERCLASRLVARLFMPRRPATRPAC